MFIGFFSEKAAVLYGSCFYLTEDGKELEVTAVFRPGQESDYKWPDKILVGTNLTFFSRRGRSGETPFAPIYQKIIDRPHKWSYERREAEVYIASAISMYHELVADAVEKCLEDEKKRLNL